MMTHEKSQVDLLLSGGFILPMDGRAPLSESAIAVKGDRILDMGRQADLFSKYQAEMTLDMSDHLIMPGLINTHTHAAMSLFRGLADDLPLMDWLNHYIFPAEKRIDKHLVYLGTQLSCLEMIRTGTTTFKDMYLYEEAVAEAAAQMGTRAVVGEVLYDFPSPNYGSPEDGLAYTHQLIKKWHGHPLVRIAVEPHSPYLCAPDLLRQANRIAIRENCLFAIHLAETADELKQIRERYGTTPVRHMERLGILGPHVLAVHSVWLDDEEIRIMAEHQVKVAHCAESNMKLAAGIAPVPKLLQAGVTVGLGTDGCASNNNLDMFQEMDTAAKLHKVATSDPTVMDAQTTLEMATIKGAKALGLEDEIGSLEPGKKADIICLDLNQPHLTPLYNIPSQLVYAASGLDVDTVIINGRILLRDRCFTQCDPGNILKEAGNWAQKISEKL